MNSVTLLGIDIGENSFHLHGQDAQGHQVLRKKLNRSQLLPLLTQMPPRKVAMEPCGGSRSLARKHQARPSSPTDCTAACEGLRHWQQERIHLCRGYL